MSSSINVLGTMAFDCIETPFAKSGKIIGGSASFIAYAASLFAKVNQLSIIGNDFPLSTLEELKQRNVSIEGVTIDKSKKSFFWHGKYHLDMNQRDTLETQLNVLENFSPILPPNYQHTDYLLLGNATPKIQLDVLQQHIQKPTCILLDTMNLWIDIQYQELLQLLKKIDILLINDSEAKQLTKEYSLLKAAQKIHHLGVPTIIIKKGEHGAIIFQNNEVVIICPAMPLEDIFDPTGAGDSFAGAFMGYLAQQNNQDLKTLKKASLIASAVASFTIEKFGVERLRTLTHNEINQRVNILSKLSQIE